MSTDLHIPAPAETDLVTTTIKVGPKGKLKPLSSAHDVLSISVNREVNRIPRATIMLDDGDAAKGDFELASEETLIPGQHIEVMAGYHKKEDLIFTGIIVKIAVKIRPNRSSMLVVDCKEEVVKTTIGRKNRYFDEGKDSDMIEEVLADYKGMKHDVQPTKVKHKRSVQYHATDWDFLVSRADANGQCVFVEHGKVVVKKPDTTQKTQFGVLFGSSLIEMDAVLDAECQFTSVTGQGWDPTSQEILNVEATDPKVKEAGNLSSSKLSGIIGLKSFDLQHPGYAPEAELQAWADGCWQRSQLSRMRGRVTFDGVAKLMPGHTIQLDGVGDRFKGPVFVSGVRHTIQRGEWLTDAQFGLSPESFIVHEQVADKPAGGLLPAVNGLHTGIVTQVEDDPEGEDRVKVVVPVVDPKGEGIWARISALDAGNGRGTYFRPEVGDEVVLGFLNDDPRNPIVLGMLNSSELPAPFEANKKNDERGLVSKSGSRIVFDDKKRSILLQTVTSSESSDKDKLRNSGPKEKDNHMIRLDDDSGSITIQDKNGNEVILDKSGITIKSAKDVNITAKGDVKISGTNIDLKAKASMKAVGNSGAEISSGASTVVKGSMVQIN